jgi:hypothetical protein
MQPPVGWLTTPAARLLSRGFIMPVRRFLFLVTLVAAWSGGAVPAAEPRPIAPDQFVRLHRMIRVQPDEQGFWQIPWKLTIAEAREQAAHEGKPIFVWAGAGGAPIGVC